MIITIASFKGGVGKTTTAIHLAAYFQGLAPTLLIDGDSNRSALLWASQGTVPFKVVDERQAVRHTRDYEHIIIDTAARPGEEDLKVLVGGCDLLILPTTPDSLALGALKLTLNALKKLGSDRFKILLTIIPPKPNRDGAEAHAMLVADGLPVFNAGIRQLRAAYQKAALTGVPVSAVREKNAKKAWTDYQAIGKEITS